MTGDNVVAGKDAPPSSMAAADAPPPVLADLVRPTAGQVIALTGSESISGGVKAMLDDFRASYVLQYVPHGVASEGWHEISVAVKKHPRYEIRARKGYKGQNKITVSEVAR